MQQKEDKTTEGLVAVINKLLIIIVVLVITIIIIPFILLYKGQPQKTKDQLPEVGGSVTSVKTDATIYWSPPDVNSIADASKKEQVEYGRELIAHTAKYLGPNGSVLKMSNGLNCQNCHLQAGTAVWGNNYGSVAATYPKFRARSGKVEDVYKRVNDCFERSLNGQALNKNSREMQAIVSYINFVGSNVEKGKKAPGSGFKDLAYLDRAANPENGKVLYAAKCQSCHQGNGEGVFNGEKTEYIYPPLWGKQSFNDGAGLFRLSNFAKYIKNNMPQGATYQNPQLTDEEAWDIAAFVNTQSRPHMNTSGDWPDKSKKSVDNPFGPYADNFTEFQHKYGPFKPIEAEKKKKEELAKQKQTIVIN